VVKDDSVLFDKGQAVEEEEDIWYFAYGSNLSRDRKQNRTGAIREARAAQLVGYRLCFNKRVNGGGVYANIVPDAGSEVWGVVYRCNSGAISRLDGCEGVADGHYHRVPVIITTADGQPLAAEVYIATPEWTTTPGKPSAEYLDHILQGAQEHGLPAEYIQEIRRLGQGTQ
jgi:gamma-glutamylcyclotransferase